MTSFLIKKFIKGRDTADCAVRAEYGRLAGVVGIVCNAFLFAAKLIAGLMSGSISIMADAVNNLSDASSSIITLVGFKLSTKPADKEHPFGHARFEYVSALAVAMMILVIGFELGRTSLEKIFAPTPVEFTIITAAILISSIGVKLWMMLFNNKIGKIIKSQTIKATAQDSRNDVIATAAVLIAAIVAALTKINLDGYMGLAVAIFIVYSGIRLVIDTLDPILGAAPSPELVRFINEKIMSYPEVLGTHDLTVHDYGPGRCFASAHVEMAAEKNALESHDIIDNIERDFCENSNIKLVIHYDPILTGDEAIGTTRELVNNIIHEISPRLTMHDFRMVQGVSHTNLIFDVVLPTEHSFDKKELLKDIDARAKSVNPNYYTVVTLDESYATYT